MLFLFSFVFILVSQTKGAILAAANGLANNINVLVSFIDSILCNDIQ